MTEEEIKAKKFAMESAKDNAESEAKEEAIKRRKKPERNLTRRNLIKLNKPNIPEDQKALKLQATNLQWKLMLAL